MELHLWFSLVLICLLGALSPGPSLALVIRNTVWGDKQQGLVTAISHGLGVALYAAISVTGIGLVLLESPTLYSIIQYAGALFLLYLAFKALRSSRNAQSFSVGENSNNVQINGWRDGFLIAFLNPKLALFFLALFSQFVDVNASWQQKVIMVATVGGIDTLWYCMVAIGLSRGSLLTQLRDKSQWIDRITGLFLLLLAVRVVL